MKSQTHKRLTSQAAVQQIGNQYQLVLIAANRMRELNNGAEPKVSAALGTASTALLEIEAGLVGHDYLFRETVSPPKYRPRITTARSGRS